MSYRKYATPLSLTLKPSRLATFFYSVVALSTAMFCFFLPIESIYQWGLVICIALTSDYILLVEWRQLKNISIGKITWQEENYWQLETSAGEVVEAELIGDSLNTLYLVVLNFRIEGRRRAKSVVLFQDSADEELLRKLRVRLKVQSHAIS